MKSPSCVHSESVHCLLFADESSETCTNRKLEGHDRQHKRFYCFPGLRGSPSEASRVVWWQNLCSRVALWCVCALSAWYQRLVFLLINIILEPQISIITSVIMIAFPLIISVTLHTGLWKLAPYFKEKRKKKVCYSIVCYKKRTIDCGLQFKDDICQQMPCIIWHCRN